MNQQIKISKLDFACCFCGKGSAEKGLALTSMGGEFEQQWWCHVGCLLDAMDETFRAVHLAEGEDEE